MLLKKILFLLGVIFIFSGSLLFLNNYFSGFIINVVEFVFMKDLNSIFWRCGLSRMGLELIILSLSFFSLYFFYEKYPKRTMYSISGAWILIFIIYLVRDSVNIPIADDYEFLVFLNSISLSGKISDIFFQTNESKRILMPLAGFLLYKIHLFNYYWLIYFSNACIFCCYLLLCKSIKADEKINLWIVPLLAIFIFQFQYYDSSLWASGAFYSAVSICFGFFSIYFLTKINNRNYFLSFLFALLTTLNSGIGFILLPIGILLLFQQQRINELFIWFLIMTIGIIFYFKEYSFPPTFSFNDFNAIEITQKILHSFLFSCVFLGSAFQFLYKVQLPLIVGLIVWIVFIFLSIKKYFKINKAVYFFLLFLILTSFLPAIFRIKNLDLQAAMQNRYGIYSVFVISCCVIALFEIVKKKYLRKILISSLVCVVAYHLLTDIFFYPEVPLRKERLIIMMKNIQNGNKNIDLPLGAPDNAEEIIKKAIENGYYFPDY